MRKGLILAIGCLFMSGFASGRTLGEVQKSGTLKIVTATYAPFVVNENNTLSGFEIELAQAVADKMKLKPEFIVRPFAPILNDLNTKPGDFDLAIASHTVTSTRLKDNIFAKPHYCTGGAILTRPNGPTTSKELQGHRVAATIGTVQFNFLRKLPFTVDILQQVTSDGTMESVSNGKAEAAIVDFIAGLDAVAKSSSKLKVSDPLWKEQIAMAFAKDNNDLRNAVNTALSAVMADGTYAKLSQKYFDRDIRCK